MFLFPIPSSLLLALVLIGMASCSDFERTGSCRPLQVYSNTSRQDWYYRKSSEQPQRVEIIDSAGRLIESRTYTYENDRLKSRTTVVKGRTVEQIVYQHNGAGQVSVRERFPQISGEFELSFGRERRKYNTAGQCDERTFERGPASSPTLSRIEKITYDPQTGCPVQSHWFEPNEADSAQPLYSTQHTYNQSRNVLIDFWQEEPVWTSAPLLLISSISRFRNGNIDSSASFVLDYESNGNGLPEKMRRIPFRGTVQEWRFDYSCR